MHSLMRDYLQNQQQKDELELFKQVHQFLFSHYDNQLELLEHVVDIGENHSQALLEASYHQQQWNVKEFPSWIGIRGQLFNNTFAWDIVEPLYNQALELAEEHLDAMHPDVAISLNNLATLYQTQGDYAKAEPLYQRSLSIRETSLGQDHPDVAQSLNNLAVLYQDQGRYAKAEPLYQRAVTILEQVFPDGHQNLETIKSNYASMKTLQQKQDRNE